VLPLDEPPSALDAHLRERAGGVKRLQSQLGTTFVMVTTTRPSALSILTASSS
jgi:spermidine/putrescine transport system ATP-binding protein